MTKQLFIHIGHFKTGTTALQVLCQAHRRKLARAGINYSDLFEKNSKHSPYAFSIYKKVGVPTLLHGFANPTPPEEMWRQLFDSVRASKCDRTLISSEEFMRMGEFPEAEALFADIVKSHGQDIDIRIIAYLRAPGAQTRSWYNQLIKMRQQVSDFNTALLSEIESIHYDYQRALAPWIRLFGQDALTLRLYPEGAASREALPRDFLSIFGVDLPLQSATQTDPNPRMDERGLDLIRIIQNLGLKPSPVGHLQSNLAAFMEHQGANLKQVEAGLAQVEGQSQASIAGLVAELGEAADLSPLLEDLPQGDPIEDQSNSLMIGFVLSELVSLRRRINKAGLFDVEDRLAAIEQHLGIK